VAIFLCLLAGAAVSQPGIPALIYDSRGKRHGGFNEPADKGAERFRGETGVTGACR
jgi:hypothetical protein